jgi:glycosyltransferase involved in cell wall biosynthesis
VKKIAVVTPVYNGEKFIKDCIDSVFHSIKGTSFTIEHILVDDFSTDRSWGIMQSNSAEGIKAFRLETNIGSSGARNFGVAQTDADFIFCLDQDDVLFQSSLKTLFEYMEEKRTEWVYGDFLRADKNLSYLVGEDYYGHQFSNVSELLTAIFLGEHFFQQNSLYTKELFEKVGGFDKDILTYQDLDLFIRFALQGVTPLYVSGPLYMHRFHRDNFSKISGREGNLLAHKQDLKTLYSVYEESLKSTLAASQIEKILIFFSQG